MERVGAPTLSCLCKVVKSVNKVETYVMEQYESRLLDLGLEFADIEYAKEGQTWFLRIYLDRTDGAPIQLTDCEKASRLLSETMDADEAFPVERAYTLEVSSPGIERVLKRPKDFIRFTGETVKIRLYQAFHNQKNLVGLLTEADENGIVLRVNGEDASFLYQDIAKANIHFEF